MLLIVLAIGCVLAVPLTGGDLRRLAGLEVRGLWLAFGGLLLQIGIVDLVPDGSHAVHAGLHVASYGFAAAFVAANRHIAGIAVMAAGGALNLLAIAANGGVMPASPWAIAHSGLALGDGFDNSAALENAHLLALGDVIPVPAGPLANVLRVGDLVIFAGLALLLLRVCAPRRAEVATA